MTPIERAADALGANGAEGSDEDLLADARAVFESIDRESLYSVIIEAHLTGSPGQDRVFNPEHHGDQVSAYMLADAILAHLTGGES